MESHLFQEFPAVSGKVGVGSRSESCPLPLPLSPFSAHPRTLRRPSVSIRAAGARFPRTRCRAGTGPRGWLRLSTCRRDTPRTPCSACPGTSTRGRSPPRTRGTPRSGPWSHPGSSHRRSGTRRRQPPRTAPTCSAGPHTRCMACMAQWHSPHPRRLHLGTGQIDGEGQGELNCQPFGHLGYRAWNFTLSPL